MGMMAVRMGMLLLMGGECDREGVRTVGDGCVAR